jgi:hypothetical protein
VVGWAGSADDRRAAGPGELRRCGAHAARGAVDQEGRVGGDAEQVQGPHGGLGNQWQPRCHGPRYGWRLERELVHDGVLGCAAGDREPEHLVPERHDTDTVADLVNHSSDVTARDAGQRERHHLLECAAAQFAVDRIDGRRAYRDPDLAGTGVRLIDIDDTQYRRVAVLGELDRLHRPPSNSHEAG